MSGKRAKLLRKITSDRAHFRLLKNRYSRTNQANRVEVIRLGKELAKRKQQIKDVADDPGLNPAVVLDQRGFTVVELLIAIATVLIVIGVIAAAALKPYYEARSFNRCTGGNASYMDALTTELRVERCNR